MLVHEFENLTLSTHNLLYGLAEGRKNVTQFLRAVNGVNQTPAYKVYEDGTTQACADVIIANASLCAVWSEPEPS